MSGRKFYHKHTNTMKKLLKGIGFVAKHVLPGGNWVSVLSKAKATFDIKEDRSIQIGNAVKLDLVELIVGLIALGVAFGWVDLDNAEAAKELLSE